MLSKNVLKSHISYIYSINIFKILHKYDKNVKSITLKIRFIGLDCCIIMYYCASNESNFRGFDM